MASFRAPLFVFLLIGLTIAFAPLLMFTPQLLRARISGVRQYGSLMSDYARRFHERWVGRRSRATSSARRTFSRCRTWATPIKTPSTKLGVFLFARADALLVLMRASCRWSRSCSLQSPAPEVINRIVGIARRQDAVSASGVRVARRDACRRRGGALRREQLCRAGVRTQAPRWARAPGRRAAGYRPLRRRPGRRLGFPPSSSTATERSFPGSSGSSASATPSASASAIACRGSRPR